jgi:hypothetical protein
MNKGDFSLQVAGLMTFILVVVVNFITLIVDLSLKAWDHPTISQHVWNGCIWLGAFLVAWQVLGVIGLSLHFWATY